VLLGIKYEAARIGEVGEAALAGIEEQIRGEVGDGWESNDQVLSEPIKTIMRGS
jgi:hypothetical protein